MLSAYLVYFVLCLVSLGLLYVMLCMCAFCWDWVSYSLIQQVQKYLMKRSNLKDSRSVCATMIFTSISATLFSCSYSVVALCELWYLLCSQLGEVCNYDSLYSDKNRSTLQMQVSLPFIANAVSTSVWVAAVCLFLELLGFSTHKWLAAGGMGTVLLTLAGREVTRFMPCINIIV